MGFPNKGLNYVKKQLETLIDKLGSHPNPTPLFINLGKNRHTPLEKAVLDYKKGMLELQNTPLPLLSISAALIPNL